MPDIFGRPVPPRGLLSPEPQGALSGLLPTPAQQGILGFGYRPPYQTENAFFAANPHVGGMASEDARIVMNPHSTLKPEERQAVAHNEAMRLWMQQNNFSPDFQITPEQQQSFQGTAYGSDPAALRRTLLARMLTGDPSAGQQTFEQNTWANRLAEALRGPFAK